MALLKATGSLSNRFSGMAAQLMAMNGSFARRLFWKIERATNSLPVPLSPVINAVASEAANCPMSLKTSCIGALRPMTPNS
jgi:hypothetical protein